jgi:hypothetical protein
MLQVLRYEFSQMTYTVAHYSDSRISKLTHQYSSHLNYRVASSSLKMVAIKSLHTSVKITISYSVILRMNAIIFPLLI